MTSRRPTKPYWSQSQAELFAELATSGSGLAQEDAIRRVVRFGENRVAEQRSAGVAALLFRQYQSPLVLILIFGALVSLALGDWTDALLILAIVFGSTLLGFAQEYRASEALKRLRDRLALRVKVLRGGRTCTIESRKVVPGDVLLLSAGNIVPADGVVIAARDFLVSQAALTGRSFPVEKAPGLSVPDSALQQRSNAVFLGSSVRSGTARVLVTRTGRNTEFAAIAGRLADAEPVTDFERGVRRFGYMLTRIMTGIVIFVITVNLLLDRPLVASLLFAVALAVGLTPELLPAIVSVTLSAGARRMSKRGVIVRRLEAIENLGSIDVLCTDKTGTLTRGVVELTSSLDPGGSPSDLVFRYAAINSCLETGIENPLDAAIVEKARRRGVGTSDVRKVDEIPYDFLRKRLTIVVDDGKPDGTHLMLTKGAFDNVISCCKEVAGRPVGREFDAALLAELQALYEARGAEGYRVLGLASRRIQAQPAYTRADESDMTFEGFLLFFDPLKEDIQDTLTDLSRLGIGVKIITGDNRHVAEHVAKSIGLGGARILTGRQLTETNDEALWHLAETTDVFAELDPQQKERIVRALQHRGHAVGYMGDGINDAPAMHVADVAISVDQAVDVARESADIVLLQRDLNVLRVGVLDGRRTFANTFKYVAITTSANFGNMISMALGTLIVPFLPLLAKQILMNNFLSDIPAVALSTDNVDRGATQHAQRWDIGSIRRFMLVFGLMSTAFDLLTFALLLEVFDASEPLFQTTWFVVSLLTELAALLVLRTHLPVWQSRPSRLLVASAATISVIAVCLPFVDFAARGFGFVPLPAHLLLSALAIVALYAAVTEIAKRLFYAEPSRRLG
ncbi:MAG: magnesium-translocating P-type ATPase [Hyphomicrobium sp.]|nr:magnesium-translocating P-type ATPase [Hyphomicrobium sp.]